jgi:hypothetical protein
VGSVCGTTAASRSRDGGTAREQLGEALELLDGARLVAEAHERLRVQDARGDVLGEGLDGLEEHGVRGRGVAGLERALGEVASGLDVALPVAQVLRGDPQAVERVAVARPADVDGERVAPLRLPDLQARAPQGAEGRSRPRAGRRAAPARPQP